MKELDFDELDRAVSSLMAGTSSAPAQPTEKVLTIPSTLAEEAPRPTQWTTSITSDPAPKISSPKPTGTPGQTISTHGTTSFSQGVRPPSHPPMPSRRVGRFMDVVRPSDTKPSSMGAPSREGISVSAPTPPVHEEVAAAPVPVPAQPMEDTPSSWPDPIDFQSQETTSTSALPEQHAEAVVSPSNTSLPAQEEPLSTPFITDAKVEKRPLGAFAAQTEDVTDTTSTTTSGAAESVEDDPQVPDDASALTLPDELKSDIVAIESDTTAGNDEQKQSPVPATSSVQASVPQTSTPVQTSIRPQYQEGMSSTPVQHAPIYDSEPIQPPLAHPAKKRTGWLVVLIILGLLIFGAAAGTAIYFFVL